MGFKRIVAIVLSGAILATSSGTPNALGGKPGGKGGGGGGGGGDEPTSPPYTYSIQWIGTGSGVSSEARDVNNYGEVSGIVRTANGAGQAFVWSPVTGMMELNQVAPVPGYTLYGGGHINDDGIVVGLAIDDLSGAYKTYRFDPLRTEDPTTILPGSVGIGYGLNSSGDVAYDSSVPGEVLVYSIDDATSIETVTPVAIPGELEVMAFNDDGQILASTQSGLLRYRLGGSVLELPGYELPTGDFQCMNNYGDVCAVVPSGRWDNNVLWSDELGEVVIVGKGQAIAAPKGVNDSGEVCGTIKSSGWKPYLYTNGQLWVADDLLVGGGDDKWKSATSIRAASINNQGDICGYASFSVDLGGETVVFYEAFVLVRD